METVLGKLAIVGNPFLLAVGWVFGGIQVNNQPLFVLPFQEGVGGSGQGSLQGRQPSLVAQDVILQPGEHGLPGPHLMILANRQPERWIDPQKISIVAIFITGAYLVNPLTNHLD